MENENLGKRIKRYLLVGAAALGIGLGIGAAYSDEVNDVVEAAKDVEAKVTYSMHEYVEKRQTLRKIRDFLSYPGEKLQQYTHRLSEEEMQQRDKKFFNELEKRAKGIK